MWRRLANTTVAAPIRSKNGLSRRLFATSRQRRGSRKPVLSSTSDDSTAAVVSGVAEGARWPSKEAVKWVRQWRGQRKKAALVLEARGDLADVRKPNPLRQLRGDPRPPPALLPLVGALRKAAADDQVAVVYMRIGNLMCSMARVEELRDAIRDVSKKKPVVGYMVSGGELEIALGASCTELHVSPGGYAALNGFAQRSVLLRGLLDSVGVEPEVSQIGPWKGGHVLSGDPVDGAGEPPEVKEQTRRMLAEQRRRYVDGIASDSGMATEVVDGLLSKGLMGEALSSTELFKSVRYEDEVACEVLERASGIGNDQKQAREQSIKSTRTDALWLSLETYSKASADALGLEPKRLPWYKAMFKAPKPPTVAVLPLSGQIFFGEGGRSNTPRIFHEPVVAAIRAATERKDIKAVVLRVDSPGGDALASELIWRAVGLLRNEKPVLASMGSVAASGGYFIPMACSKIFAQPSTVTGSIGVISAKFSSAALLKRLRIWTAVTTAGDDSFAGMQYAAHRPWSEEEWHRMNHWTREIYDGFVEKVALSRHLSAKLVDQELAQGRIWSGEAARELGLVDEIGGLEQAICAAAEAAGLGADAYRRELLSVDIQSPLEKLAGTKSLDAATVATSDLLMAGLTKRILVGPVGSLAAEMTANGYGAEPALVAAAELEAALLGQGNSGNGGMRPLAILPSAIGL